MTKGIKKRGLILSIALAIIAMIAALFCVFKAEKKSIQATAASSSSERFYFENGAATSTSSMLLNRLSYYLVVYEDVIPDLANSRIYVEFPYTDEGKNFTYATGAYIEKVRYMQLQSEGYYEPGDEIEDKISNTSVWATDPSSLIFEDGKAVLGVQVYAQFTVDVTLEAYINYGGDKVATATSDTRSSAYVWQKAVEYEDAALIGNPYVPSVVEFMEGDTSALRVHDDAMLSSETGLRLMVNVPTNVQEEIAKERVQTLDVWDGTNGSSWLERNTATFLVITRAETKDAFSATDTMLKEGEGYVNYWYGAEENLWIIDGENALVVPEFYGKTYKDFYLPIPTDSTQEYYYYAQVVKAQRNWDKYMYGVVAVETPTRPRAWTARSDAPTFTMQTLAEDILARDLTLSENENQWLQDMAGIAIDSDSFSVTIEYKAMATYARADIPLDENETIVAWTDGYTSDRSIITKERTIDGVKSSWALNKAMVISAVLDTTEFDSISDFNVVLNTAYYKDGIYYETGSRIILTANGYEYTFDKSTNTGRLTVLYNSFDYKDLSLRVSNNDPENHLIMDVYTSHVRLGPETLIRFDYYEISEELKNTADWLFELGYENITYTPQENVTVTLTKYGIEILYPAGSEDLLMNLNLTAVAEIIEDVEYTVTYEYVQLSTDANGKIVKETKESEPISVKYSSLMGEWNITNVMTWYGDTINGALTLDCLDGQYLIPQGLEWKSQGDYAAGNYTAKVAITYEYNTLFEITKSNGAPLRYVALEKDTLTYNGGDVLLASEIPSGFRVEKMTTTTPGYLTITTDDKKPYNEWTLQVAKQDVDRIIPVHIVFTDKWDLVINHFETYKITPFALKKSTTKTIKVADYPDIYALTLADIKAILGAKTLLVGACTYAEGMVAPDEDIKVTFDGLSTYTATLTYGCATIASIQNNGKRNEIKVPLTSYSAWCKSFGEDWTIMFLNTQKTKYFQYSNEVNREDLYGFFSVAVFDGRVSDFNYWFQNNTGAGCMTLYSARETSGSMLYGFFNALATSGEVASTIVGNFGMYLCELFNHDNTIYQSYYFYLDGSVAAAYIAANGATNAFDTETSMQNWWENGFLPWFNGLGENPWLQAMGIMFGIVVVVLFVGVIYWLLEKFGIIQRGGKKKTAYKRKKSPTSGKKKGGKK